MEILIPIIIFIVFSGLMGKKKPKSRTGSEGKSPSYQQMTVEQANTAPTKPKSKSLQEQYHQRKHTKKTSNTILQNTKNRAEEDNASEEPTEIEKRRIQQQEAANRSRIHQSIRSQVDEDRQEDSVTQMKTIRELIVCGYPVKIPGERDFIKEGEDFLASLNNNSIFY